MKHGCSVLSRSKGDSLEFVVEQKRIAAQVMQALGSVHEEQKAKDKAIEAFREALQYDDANEKVCLIELLRPFKSKETSPP